MAKTIFEKLGGKYERQGDYLIPCIALPAEEEQPIGTWGQRHLDYLKQYCKVTYTNLLTSGKLNAYLIRMDRTAQQHKGLCEGDCRKRTHICITGYRQGQKPCRYFHCCIKKCGKINFIDFQCIFC